jgi:adenylate cyclase
LISAEVEFSNEAESNEFIPPQWLGQEVTDDKRYKNQSLALCGVLKENKIE